MTGFYAAFGLFVIGAFLVSIVGVFVMAGRA